LIDLHCHALPGDEGGPADLAEGVALLHALAADGVDTVAVTPYIRDGAPAEVAAGTRERVAELRSAARGADVPALLPGAEVDLGWALSAPDEALRHATFGGLGKTLMVRTPTHETRADFDDMLLNLTLRGYGVLLAQPERSPSYQAAPARLGRLVAEGVLVQLAAGSLVAPSRAREHRLAIALIQEQAAHVIASSAHGMKDGPPRMAEAVAAAAKAAGQRAQWMATAAPAAILAGAPLPDPPTGGGNKSRRR
jgi:protein-tyrosine phosphatase